MDLHPYCKTTIMQFPNLKTFIQDEQIIEATCNKQAKTVCTCKVSWVNKRYWGEMIGIASLNDETVKSRVFQQYKQAQLCRLSHDFIGFLTIINYTSGQKLTL